MFIVTIIYFLVGLLASTIGAIAGLGGGIIIKPVLDGIGTYDVATIGILSAATVFAMACVSLLKAARSGVKVNGKVSYLLAIGSISGGIIGKFFLTF
ncbi:TSUP family transporter [Bacillus sp. N9]